MKTILLNPGKKRRRAHNPPRGGGARPTIVVVRAGGAPRRNAAMPAMIPVPAAAASNPRRRRRSNPSKRRRRHNPVKTRRFSRRNPFDLRMLLDVGLRAGAAGGASYLINKLLISQVGTDAQGRDTRNGMLMRNALRVGVAAVGVAWVGGTIGTAFAGAMMYPAAYELDRYWRVAGTSQTLAGSSDRLYKPEGSEALAAGAEDTKALEAALNSDLEAALNDSTEWNYAR